MQLELPNSPNQTQYQNTSHSPQYSLQYGSQRYDSNGSPRSLVRQRDRNMSSESPTSETESLKERLGLLNVADESRNGTPLLEGQASALRHRTNLNNFPNEILTHIISHLNPDSLSSVGLVSKRFHALVTSPHAWRMAFQRHFPAQDALVAPNKTSNKPRGVVCGEEDDDTFRSEVRVFTRLTPHASWRSEYLSRTRLLRSLSRGKPGVISGGVGIPTRAIHTGKKATAVLTYNTKVPSVITHLHATFKPNGKKSPRVIHGAADLGVVSASDPSLGKVEKWGLDDPFTLTQMDEVMPLLIPYGMGDGPAAVPNVIDVSQPYGLVGGEGFPGGRVFFRPTGEYRGKYLGEEAGFIEAHPDIPKIPELSEGICSVWVAKSPSVPTVTRSLVGIMTGSSLGVVTAFALGHDASGPRYTPGEMSARWVLSPGVPIIALKVDDNYNMKRKAMNRVWAVALNALGEVYYLTQPPTPPATKTKVDDTIKLAWHTGRTTYWHLVEATRREARPDDSGRNAVRGSYSPRSFSNAMNLAKNQMVSEAREIEKFLHYKPLHFRKACYGWDMRRRLEVDFAGDDEQGGGESFFIIDCALDDEKTWALRRFTRTVTNQTLATPAQAMDSSAEPISCHSIFGDGIARSTSPVLKPVLSPSGEQSSWPTSSPLTPGMDDWFETVFSSKEIGNVAITANAIDASLMALVTSFEDPLKDLSGISASRPLTASRQASSDLPGRRARLIGLGTNTGMVVLWNMRAAHTGDGIFPVRIIQTESPEISSLALSALYLVHGGSDGLVQAWDPLASTMDPVRTLNSRSPGRMPRHLLALNPTLSDTNFSAVGAIYLDPDPTFLHGIVAFGTFVRYWAYNSTNQAPGRKRRWRHTEVQSRLHGRSHGGGVQGYIAAETEELRAEQRHHAQEQARLRSRFGPGISDMTEEEALQYAEMISQESFLLDEQRRTSASDTGSVVDFDTASTAGSMDTITPDPSVTDVSPPTGSTSAAVETMDESEYELQIQTAIRLSLLEGVNDQGRSPEGNSPSEFDGPITFKDKKGKRSTSFSPSSSTTPLVKGAELSSRAIETDFVVTDDDLELALQLSLAEEESRKAMMVLVPSEDEFPPLDGGGWGKGKGKAR